MLSLVEDDENRDTENWIPVFIATHRNCTTIKIKEHFVKHKEKPVELLIKIVNHQFGMNE